ncbi:putative receptor protein kinase ZmPK1 isoform X2 [Manihot esculenta]|uniref:Uncharacterized protein n=1 Tax=Manihot esculenta TaxID=3983 RepID=A0ACB7H2L7_MANES|nr:putative receptor protein kinase ZmPK1 isoform X2 [Manihot esculenta]KAG8646229.1 hypothetical protein MANES_10G134700v8 [Manihot esculenta]
MKFHMAAPSMLVAFFLIVSPPFSFSIYNGSIGGGSSLYVENPDDVLISPNRIFSAGFYQVGENAYTFAIWFSEPSCFNSCTVVWMLNRDVPINGRHSKLSLLETGNLILSDAGKSIVWASNTFSMSSSSLQLHDTGNLILITQSESKILWQSFDSPTDTLLPLQSLSKGSVLVSSRSSTKFSSGFYKLSFDGDNILHTLYNGPPEVSIAFWPNRWSLNLDAGRTSDNSSRIAVLDSLGKFTSSDNFNFLSADYGVQMQRRLRLDFDGNLRLYSRKNSKDNWTVSWQIYSQPCLIYGACGPNSMCKYVPSFGRKCSCLPGYKMKNPSDWSLGCEPEIMVPNCSASNQATFIQFPHVEMNGNDMGYFLNYTLDKCKELCLQRCDCKGFIFRFYLHYRPDNVPYCFPKTRLLNGYSSPHYDGNLYLKVSKTNPSKTDWLSTEELSLDCPAAAAVTQLDRRFTYDELKKATNNFKEEIGRGASGIVYKGLIDGQHRVAAIKRLNNSSQGGEAEFVAEISTAGKLNHMNLIDMWGCCAEGKHRLLVYEHMENGSLADNLSSNKSLDWKKRFEIALGTARGLAYLHEECLEWILHCDVKPQNILLDAEYRPKISDFGLSRLLKRDDLHKSSFSRIRGTRGYMAPEWISNRHITAKVDVYSYGIVVLEMVTGKSPSMGDNVEEKGLVQWVKQKRNTTSASGLWWKEMIEPVMGIEYDAKKMETLIEVALKCVEEDRAARPTMSQVVEMIMKHEN